VSNIAGFVRVFNVYWGFSFITVYGIGK